MALPHGTIPLDAVGSYSFSCVRCTWERRREAIIHPPRIPNMLACPSFCLGTAVSAEISQLCRHNTQSDHTRSIRCGRCAVFSSILNLAWESSKENAILCSSLQMAFLHGAVLILGSLVLFSGWSMCQKNSITMDGPPWCVGTNNVCCCCYCWAGTGWGNCLLAIIPPFLLKNFVMKQLGSSSQKSGLYKPDFTRWENVGRGTPFYVIINNC